MRPRAAQVGRADLLRALALHPRQQLTLSADAQHWLGYQWRAPVFELSARGQIGELQVEMRIATSKPDPEPQRIKHPLRMDYAWLVKQEPRDDAAAAPEGSATPTLQPLDEAAAAAAASAPQARQDDLLPWARLLPVLRRHLSQARGGEVDVPRLLHALASQQALRHLPRVQRRRWNPDLIVALDFGPAMTPYRTDLHRLCHQLLREVGRTGLSLRLLMHGPNGGWTDWQEEQACRPAPPARHAWHPPAAGSCVLLVSDLGQFQNRSEVTAQWLRWVRLNQAAQVQVLALTPLGAGQLQPQVARQLPVLRWSPDSRLHPERPTPPDAAPGLADLLAMLAATRRVDAPLLRALRRLNPQQPLNAGLEGAAWNHPDVQAGRVCTVQPQHQAQHLAHWRSLPPALLARQQAARSLHHQHLRAVLRHEENLLHATQARLADGGDGAASPEEQDAIKFLQRLCLTLDQGHPADLRQWLPAVQELLHRMDDSTAHPHAPLLSRLLAVAWQHTPAAARNLPSWADVPEFQRASQRSAATPVSAYVVQDFAQQQWRLQPQPPGPGQDGRAITSSTGALLCRTGEQARWLSLHTPQVLGSLEGLEPLTLETPAERWTLTPVQRPLGIAEWRRKKGLGLEVVLPIVKFNNKPLTLRETEFETAKSAVNARWHLAHKKNSPPSSLSEFDDPISSTFGIDEFGVYWDLNLYAQGVTQRLRYIAPGSFWMGSTLAEQEAAAQGDENYLKSIKDESPVHQVTLTEGFWLADTACTQALWLALVGGENPSRFKDDTQCPVEKVSWDDVKEKFLPQLQALLPPDCEATLPTEAQWEYACRAGTSTPFSFGDNITPSLVNYDGNYPYNGGEKGEYRERTVPVKTFPANGWGLYEMHGNVWEWCWDEKRNYAEGAVVDPLGAIGDGPRPLRGGSWRSRAKIARSAYRIHFDRFHRYVDFGFRVALRFKPQGPEARVPQAEPAGLRRGSAPTAAAAGSPQNPALPQQQASRPQKPNPSRK